MGSGHFLAAQARRDLPLLGHTEHATKPVTYSFVGKCLTGSGSNVDFPGTLTMTWDGGKQGAENIPCEVSRVNKVTNRTTYRCKKDDMDVYVRHPHTVDIKPPIGPRIDVDTV